MAKATTGPTIKAERQWPLAKIIPYPKNARTHPPAQVALLAQMLKRWEPDQAIVVDEQGVILKGHGRRIAALEAGLKKFPVVQRVGLPDIEKEALRLADTQSALLAGWDNALVQSAMVELKTAGYPMELLGFGEAQLVQFMTTPGPPGEFPAFGTDIATEHQCPKCGYVWSGNSAPKPVDEPKPAKTRKKK